MSKISDLVGDPHWNSAKVKEINKKVLATEKRFMNVANALAKKLDISAKSAHDIMQSDTAFDVFKNAVKIGTDESDKIMKNVDHPSHYQTSSGIEVIDVIEAFDLGFNLGNVIKYVLRCGKKDADVQELEKAKWYLEREISNRKSK